jgi:hypothetical protein
MPILFHQLAVISILTAPQILQTLRVPHWSKQPSKLGPSHQNDVNDCSVKVPGGLQCITTPDGYVIPINSVNGFPYIHMRPYNSVLNTTLQSGLLLTFTSTTSAVPTTSIRPWDFWVCVQTQPVLRARTTTNWTPTAPTSPMGTTPASTNMATHLPPPTGRLSSPLPLTTPPTMLTHHL